MTNITVTMENKDLTINSNKKNNVAYKEIKGLNGFKLSIQVRNNDVKLPYYNRNQT